jgi:hypothetical protein
VIELKKKKKEKEKEKKKETGETLKWMLTVVQIHAIK